VDTHLASWPYGGPRSTARREHSQKTERGFVKLIRCIYILVNVNLAAVSARRGYLSAGASIQSEDTVSDEGFDSLQTSGEDAEENRE
jgi:hypothetical protein